MGNALRGVGKFYVAGRVRGHRGSPSRGRDRKLSLGEDTTLTIRARAKQLRLPPFSRRHTYEIRGKNAAGARNDYGNFFQILRSYWMFELSSSKEKNLFYARIKDFDLRRLRIFGRKKQRTRLNIILAPF